MQRQNLMSYLPFDWFKFCRLLLPSDTCHYTANVRMLTYRDKIKNLSHATNILFILSSCIKYPGKYLTSKTLVSRNTNTFNSLFCYLGIIKPYLWQTDHIMKILILCIRLFSVKRIIIVNKQRIVFLLQLFTPFIYLVYFSFMYTRERYVIK